ncbi:MAG: helix-turn-helix domain-containing protein [Chloroflexi bacterium]|nr:helix-turn-helix domain-containing protein [Chloroflexota bacterium]MCL5276043.1 helix-turn-helix domain-containing protein [Chloroflexota bacterium]
MEPDGNTSKPVRSGQRLRTRNGRHSRASVATGNAPAEVNVGYRLRQLRAVRELSIRTLAETSGLSANTLSLIENGKTSPSVSTLQRLAGALGVSIAAFFETSAVRSPVVFMKAGQCQSAQFAHGLLVDLGAGMSEQAIQPFMVMMEPDSGSGPEFIVHTGVEFVFCLKGRITYFIVDSIYVLDAGDSLLFEAHLPHRWHNLEQEPSQSLLVLCPADDRDRPTDRHFAPQ